MKCETKCWFTHSSPALIRCQVCGKQFIQQSNFSRHQRTHTREKPYACVHCEEKFSYSTSLKNHLQRRHGVEPLRCPRCSKTFLNTTSRTRHHTGCELRECLQLTTLNSNSYHHSGDDALLGAFWQVSRFSGVIWTMYSIISLIALGQRSPAVTSVVGCDRIFELIDAHHWRKIRLRNRFN